MGPFSTLPQDVILNRAHPIARGVQLAVLGNQLGAVDLVTGIKPTGTAKADSGIFGRCLRFDTVGDGYSYGTLQQHKLASATAISVLAAYRFDNGGIDFSLFNCSSGSTGFQIIGAGTGPSTNFRFVSQGVAVSSDSSGGGVDAWQTMGMSYTLGGAYELWCRLTRVTGSTGMNALVSTQAAQIGGVTGTSAGRGCFIAVIYVFNRYVPGAEYLAFQRNPFALLIPAAQADSSFTGTSPPPPPPSTVGIGLTRSILLERRRLVA